MTEKRNFDLDLLPTEGLKKEFREFLFYRGQILKLGSIRTEFWAYHLVCRFLKECCTEMESLLEKRQEELEHSLRKWLLKNGYRLAVKKNSPDRKREKTETAEAIRYLKKIYGFVQKQNGIGMEDIWSLEGRTVRSTNPVVSEKSLSFVGIGQETMREEVKQAVGMTLPYLAVRTIQQQILAAKRFSVFLYSYNREWQSFQELTREALEAYLIYLNTEVDGVKSFRSELESLKSLLDTVGRITECPKLCNLFFPGDIPSGRDQRGYRVYSDAELLRLNRAIVRMDAQVARALMLHQLLGNRISETLTLRKDCLVKKEGQWMVEVYQVKTRRRCYKPASKDVIRLIQKAGAYTQECFGNTGYLFVSRKNPDQPMSYGTIQYHLTKMILEKQLKDDHGRLFGVGTHIFRRSYGKRLTELHVDDETIARLLGHKDTQSVVYYRKLGDEALARETETVRGLMDEILSQITEDWE